MAMKRRLRRFHIGSLVLLCVAAVTSTALAPAQAKPAPPAAPPIRRTARTGMTVEHPKYGTGTVVRREGDGEDAKITVNFPRYGLKKLIEKYAGLKRS